MPKLRAALPSLMIATCLIGPGSLLASPASANPTVSSPSLIPTDVSWVKTKTSLLGKHIWYRQMYEGLPVLDAYYARHIMADGLISIADGRVLVNTKISTSAKIAPGTATENAHRALRSRATNKRAGTPATSGPVETQTRLAIQGGKRPVLVWQVLSSSASGVDESRLDATTGAVLSSKSLAQRATGEGQVFAKSPPVALNQPDLGDNNNANLSVFGPAYTTLPLTQLTDGTSLRGKYARITNKGVATSTDGTFNFTREDGRFEQVNAYWGVTTTQEYLQSLGFTDVNNEPQNISVNTLLDDNSFYNPAKDSLQFGRGGVDDAEDSEIVWHEYGHAILDDQVPGFRLTDQTGAIGEGFGDFWAMINSQPFSGTAGLACIGEWDSSEYTAAPHCLRRVDGTKTTDDLVNDVHDDGEIWSRALFDISQKLGRDKAAKLVIESHFKFTPVTNFNQGATTITQTAAALYGAEAEQVCRDAFTARKITVS